MANDKLMQHIAKVSAEVASRTTLEYLEKQQKEQKRKRVDMRLRNTKLMLRNYQNFKRHCESIPEELEELDNSILNDLNTDELAVDAIKQSKGRTMAMINYIDKMIAVYKFMCEQSGREEDLRCYESIYFLYISEKKMTANEIAKCHFTDKRTVYRDVDRACEALSALIFGIDSVRFIE